MVVFGAVAVSTGVVSDTNDCSCWCAPLLGNVLPYAIGKDYVSLYQSIPREAECVYTNHSNYGPWSCVSDQTLIIILCNCIYLCLAYCGVCPACSYDHPVLWSTPAH